MKFLVVLLAVIVLLWLLFGRSRISRRGSSSGGPGARKPAVSEGMVACAHCGVHVPLSEAVQRDSLHYCGAAHRDAGPKPADR